MEYSEESTAWVVSVTLVLILGFCIGTLKGIIFGLAGLVGPLLVGSLLVGIALSGTMVSAIRLICFFVFPNKDHVSRFHSSILYYSITVTLIVVACASIPYFINSDFMQWHMERAEIDKAKNNQVEKKISLRERIPTLMKVWPELVLSFFSLGLSFLIYPGVFYVKGKHIIVPGRDDWSVFTINLTYAVTDLTGRLIAAQKSHYSRTFLTIGVSCKIFIIAAAYLTACTTLGFFNQGWFIVLNVAILGLTHGYFHVAAGNCIPPRLDPSEREFGGVALSFAISLTLLVFSQLNILVYELVFK